MSEPTPAKAVDPAIFEEAAHMRGTIKKIRDVEGALVKMPNKTGSKKGGADLVDVFDPKKPKSVQISEATSFPDWQNTCVEAVRAAYDEVADKVEGEGCVEQKGADQG